MAGPWRRATDAAAMRSGRRSEDVPPLLSPAEVDAREWQTAGRASARRAPASWRDPSGPMAAPWPVLPGRFATR